MEQSVLDSVEVGRPVKRVGQNLQQQHLDHPQSRRCESAHEELCDGRDGVRHIGSVLHHESPSEKDEPQPQVILHRTAESKNEVENALLEKEVVLD